MTEHLTSLFRFRSVDHFQLHELLAVALYNRIVRLTGERGKRLKMSRVQLLFSNRSCSMFLFAFNLAIIRKLH